MIKLNLSAIAHSSVGTQDSVDLAINHVILGDLELKQLQGTLHFTRVAEGVMATGELETRAKTECMRCLIPIFEPVTIELEDIISLPGAALTQERPVRVNEDGWADLAPLVQEYVWLNMPVSPICAPDCKGICPECGGNRNLGECTCGEAAHTDPRWEALRNLMDHSDQA
ncbi:MAG: DUF177 domain-containing protein [Lysobacterales bacterium]|nr:MAG: DUF177 domain-containing protein [Xanthomonadales bacterium]